MNKTFRDELTNLINCHSKENGSNTPDFILAEYLDDCLTAFDKTTNARTERSIDLMTSGGVVEGPTMPASKVV